MKFFSEPVTSVHSASFFPSGENCVR